MSCWWEAPGSDLYLGSQNQFPTWTGSVASAGRRIALERVPVTQTQQWPCLSPVSRRQWWYWEKGTIQASLLCVTLWRYWVRKMTWASRINTANKNCLFLFLAKLPPWHSGVQKQKWHCVCVCEWIALHQNLDARFLFLHDNLWNLISKLF